jgi:hypothetical protein
MGGISEKREDLKCVRPTCARSFEASCAVRCGVLDEVNPRAFRGV